MIRQKEQQRLQWLFVLCFFCIYLGTVKADAAISFTKVESDADPQYVKLTCDLRKEGKISVADINCDILKDLGDTLHVYELYNVF